MIDMRSGAALTSLTPTLSRRERGSLTFLTLGLSNRERLITAKKAIA
jgi:hypothetical protein